MQSSVPIPGNPWPHDMVLTIETDPHSLIELLWVREAWNLHPRGSDLPPALARGPMRPAGRPKPWGSPSTWAEEWPSVWNDCVHHTELIRDPTMFDRLRHTARGSDERARLREELTGPSWRALYGDETLGDEHRQWLAARYEAAGGLHFLSKAEEPERISLAALIPSWEAGLEKVVTIPCLGSYTRVIGRHTLLVTEETRCDPRRFSEALASFR